LKCHFFLLPFSFILKNPILKRPGVYEKYLVAIHKPEYINKRLKIVKKGKNHYRWAGGKSKDIKAVRWNLSKFSDKVKNLADYHCIKCGIKYSKGELHAHHLISKTTHPHLALELDNGVSICDKCHNDFHQKYGFTPYSKFNRDGFTHIDFMEFIYSDK